MLNASPLDLMDDDELLGRSFAGPSWATWRSVIKAAWCLPLDATEEALFRSVAERDPPVKRPREFWVKVGRRGGKDSTASLLATFFATAVDYSGKVRPGEKPLILCLAVDRTQAKIVLGYIRGYFAENPVLRRMVVRETALGLELSNGTEIAIGTNSFRAVRGRSVALAILDECSFWRSDQTANIGRSPRRCRRWRRIACWSGSRRRGGVPGCCMTNGNATMA